MARTLQEIIDQEKPEVVKKSQEIASEMLLNIHLTELRERAELTQNDIAGVMGVKKPAIVDIEQVGQDVKLSFLKKYVEAIGGKLNLDIEMSDGSRFGFAV